MKQLLVTSERDSAILTGTKRGQVALIVLQPGMRVEGHHNESDQWLYVVSGYGEGRVCESEVELSPGKLLLIERGEEHELICTGLDPLSLIVFSAPPGYGSGPSDS